MWFVLALASSIVFGLSSFFMKYNSFRKWPLHPFLTGLYISGTFSFTAAAILEGTLSVTGSLLAAGLMVGAGSTFGNVLYMKALEYGPASLTSPLVNTNILFIVLMSVLLYAEALTFMESIGIVLILASISLLPLDPKERLTIPNRIWYVFVILAMILFFLRNGGLKITEETGFENTPILLYAYLFGTLWSAVMWGKRRKVVEGDKTGRAFIWGLGTGIFSFGGMQLYALALLSGPASIVSPLFATHALLVALLSFLYLKERITVMQFCILAGVFAGIILLRV
ncbi:EamA family transporter [Alteribacillus sp. JSM 102045]|uniref:EamA family transporter n=1 Tax=Alteribacillus sp. JSM 102045 TaxID=1562101 RepID=UPI0035C1657A